MKTISQTVCSNVSTFTWLSPQNDSAACWWWNRLKYIRYCQITIYLSFLLPLVSKKFFLPIYKKTLTGVWRVSFILKTWDLQLKDSRFNFRMLMDQTSLITYDIAGPLKYPCWWAKRLWGGVHIDETEQWTWTRKFVCGDSSSEKWFSRNGKRGKTTINHPQLHHK